MDITRLISRAGRRPTGVDRVELAYLRHLPQSDLPFFAIARTTLGYALLDRSGAIGILDRLEQSTQWGDVDRLSMVAWRKKIVVRQAESDLRRMGLDRCCSAGLTRMLEQHLPNETAYLNVGHSNLTDRMFAAIKSRSGRRAVVLIHDTIPLDFPQYQRAGAPERFGSMLRRVRSCADLVIYNSRDTQNRAERHMHSWGRVPVGVVAALGVPTFRPDPSALPPDIDMNRPYFVVLGTIEPRKGHDILLDVWENMIAEQGADAPGLMICGARGWNNQAVFARLDKLAAGGIVKEFSGLSDPAIGALLKQSCGLLFPSRAEGFGLPPAEAAALGVPVVSSDLAAVREVMGDSVVYASETDRYQWRNSVESLIKGRNSEACKVEAGGFVPPTWEDHFNTVLSMT